MINNYSENGGRLNLPDAKKYVQFNADVPQPSVALTPDLGDKPSVDDDEYEYDLEFMYYHPPHCVGDPPG
jgi:hypothetical protein